MIISDRHKYIFVQLPRTASTTIGRELVKEYDGQPILYKHCTYREYVKASGGPKDDYFVFSCIRNPLDDAVSRYYKLKTNYRDRYTNSNKLARRRKNFVERIEDRLYRYIQENDADFETFFLRYYRIPYNDWSWIDHKNLDFVIRFEHLQEDFAEALRLIGIEQKKPLPVRNKTPERANRYLTYYTPRTHRRARHVFGPYMQHWGYEIPPEWGDNSISWWNQAQFQFFTFLRTIYWKNFRDLAYPQSNRKAKQVFPKPQGQTEA